MTLETHAPADRRVARNDATLESPRIAQAPPEKRRTTKSRLRLPRPASRVLLFSHDSYGLGHYRRTTLVAQALADRNPETTILCVTGSPRPDLFRLPHRTDFIKLPSFTKDGRGDYVPRRLGLSADKALTLRQEIILAAWTEFRPHLVVVDHAPGGVLGELIAPLRAAQGRDPAARVVLGMRDIIDSPHRGKLELSGKTLEWMQLYDDIVVYGLREFFDVAQEYDLPQSLADKLTYVGIVSPPASPTLADPHVEPLAGSPRLLVCAGGGGDAYGVLRATIAALRGPLRHRNLSADIVTGPLMSCSKRQRLERVTRRDPRLSLMRTRRDLEELVAAADLIIGMGGYNSVYEALAFKKRLLITPRCTPREEQLERATRLERLGLAKVLRPDDLQNPSAIAQAISERLDSPPPEPTACGFTFNGADVAAALLTERVEAAKASSI